MNPSVVNYYTKSYLKTQQRCGGGDTILMGTVVKTKEGELEDDIEKGFYRILRNY